MNGELNRIEEPNSQGTSATTLFKTKNYKIIIIGTM